MGSALLLAAQLAITLQAPQTVTACEPATVTVRTEVPGTESPRIVLPDLSPFVLTRSAAAPRVTPDAAGRIWTIDEYRYTISTARTGRFTIPPFEARLRGEVRRTAPLRIEVRSAAASDSTPSILGRALSAGAAPVHFEAVVAPDTVYVGQQVTYQAAAFVEDSVQSRLRRNPEFFPPEMRSMLTYELPFVRAYLPRRGTRDECYEVPVFQRALFPLTPGRHVIPPAQLVFATPRIFSFFSRDESHELFTDSLTLVAVEPPLVARPHGYDGAVGQLAIETRIDSVGRVGDPLGLTVVVRGTGNVKFLPRPQLSIPWASFVVGPERVQIEPGRTVRGAKEFDWVLTPRASGTVELPAVRYPYFDPARESYELALTPPVAIRVAPGALASPLAASGDSAILSLRRTYRGALGEPVHDRPLFWAILLLAPLPALTLGAVRLPRRRLAPRRSGVSALRSLAAAHNASPPEARAVRRAFVLALAERLGMNVELLSRRGALARSLRRSGVTQRVADAAEELLYELDVAAFARGGSSPRNAARRALAIARAVDREARLRSALDARRSVSLLAAIALLGAASLGALDAPSAEQRIFAEAVAEYDAGAFMAAAQKFSALAHRVPRAPDAWANFGTAGWVAGDTAAAAVGWQRALRLEPLAEDVRTRLALLHDGNSGALGAVPRVPTGPLAFIGAVLWIAACTLATIHIARGQRWARTAARVAGMVGIVSGAAAVHVEAQLRADDLSVVSGDLPVRALPALAAERIALAADGEVARILERHGQWIRVELDGGRTGWAESRRLIPLALP